MKWFLPVFLFLAACATSGPQADTQKENLGEGNKDVTASLFHSVATTRRSAHLGDKDKANNGGQVEEPVLIPIYNNDTIVGHQVATWTDKDGNIHPVMRKVSGFRDYNVFTGVNTFTNTATGSGTTSGTQGQTTGTRSSQPTNNPNVPIDVTPR